MHELQRVLRHVRKAPVPCRKSCPKPFTRKRLFYEPPCTMRNIRGDRFQAQGGFFYSGALDLFYKITLLNHTRPLGRIELEIYLVVSKARNCVKVHELNTSSEFAPRPRFARPSGEDRGYGVLPIALESARALAEDSGISRITIIPTRDFPPSYRALRAYYEKFGFTQNGPDRRELEHQELSMQLTH
ncbi:hypothetical protein GF412_03425 [Candidatus Micrarchaeota archaeon]|nr:hypothetical protein [Candidatus Micrarchaeota archaeon]MBD3418002.1 hypothetical protein [Candidatus Micrarchaeota archaeon]